MFLHTLLIPSFGCLNQGKFQYLNGLSDDITQHNKLLSPVILCFSVWLWLLQQPSTKTNILLIKGIRNTKGFASKNLSAAFLYISLQPVQVGRSSLWVGSLTGTVTALSLALIGPKLLQQGHQNTMYSMCDDVLRGLVLDTVSKNKLHTHIHWVS